MEHLTSLFGEYKKFNINSPVVKNGRVTERGEFLEYFMQNVNRERVAAKYKALPIGYFANKLAGIPTKDLYYMKRMCEDRKSGYPFGKCFFGSLKPRT